MRGKPLIIRTKIINLMQDLNCSGIRDVIRKFRSQFVRCCICKHGFFLGYRWDVVLQIVHHFLIGSADPPFVDDALVFLLDL